MNLDSPRYKNQIPYPKKNNPSYRDLLKEYNDRKAQVVDNIHHDLAEEFGLLHHPKEEKLWNLAWEHGHSEGLYSVYNYYGEFAELLT